MGETIIRGLKPGTDYTFQVVPRNSADIAGAPSAEVGFTTPEDTYAPPLPTVIDTKAVGRLIHVVVDKVVAADFAGFEFHASTSNGFTPSDATLKQKGDSTTCDFMGTSDAQTWYIRVRSYDTTGNASSYTAQTSIATATYNPDDTTAPATPTGLSLSTGVSMNADGSQTVYIDASWTANGESDLAYYELRFRQGTSGNYTYTISTTNAAKLIGLIGNVSYYVSVRACDRNNNGSSWCTESITSAKDTSGPAVPTGLAASAYLGTIILTWTNPTDKDLSHVNVYRGATSTRGSAVLVAKVAGTNYVDYIGTYGATRYYWIAAEDTSGNVSTSEAGPVNATTATVGATDIAAFAVTASKVFNKIPVLEGDGWSNNWPSAGYVAWNAHKVYYNGVEYSISAGNTNKKYIYWLNGGTSYSASDTNPALTDGDFVIATNVGGTHDLAWNAIANQVVGTAHIQDLAVIDAKILSLSVGKLDAGTITSKSITLAVTDGSGDVKIQAGKTDFGDTTSGFIFGIDDSDGNKVKLHAGNSTNYINFNGVTFTFAGQVIFTSGSSGYDNLSDKPTNLSGINATEGSKLSGIEAGADVTGNHTANNTNNVGSVPAPNVAGWAHGSDVTLIDGGKIYTNSIDCVSLKSSTLTSKTITLAVTDGSGDVKIQAGKTDFGDTAAGFILGIDDSDGNKAKFQAGNSTNYINFDGTNLSWKGTNTELTTAGVLSVSNILVTGGTVSGFTSSETEGFYAGSGATRVQMKPGVGIWAGATAIGDAPFSVTSAGVVKAVSGTIAGFTLDVTEGFYAGSGATRVQMKPGVGIWAGATAIGDAPFSVTNAGVIKAASGTVGGCALASDSMGSTTFVSGPLGSGWNINASGQAEFQNAIIRGIFRTSVFEKDTVSAVNGVVVVSKADALNADMTALDSSTLTIKGETTFVVNEVIRIKDGTNDEWMLVTSATSAPTYTVARDLAGAYGANSNPAWKKGTAVVSFGVGSGTKTGFISLDSSGTNSPYMDVYGRNSTTYSDYTLHARLGWLKGITDADVGLSGSDVWGLYTDNAYIKGVIVANTGKIGGTSGWTITTKTITGASDSKIVSGILESSDWGSGAGSQIDLVNKTMKFGGSSAPKFSLAADGALTASGATLSGAITANTGYIGGTSGWTITTKTITGASDSKIVSGILESSDWGSGAGSQIDLFNKTIKFGGSSAPKFSVAADGTLTVSGADVSGIVKSSYVQASSLYTKGAYLSSSCSAGATTIAVNNTTDFPSSGSGWVIDSANDRDAISWTGKTSTTLTGCSGVLAHTVSSTNRPLVIPTVKNILISDAVNEMRFFGDRGDGTVEELAAVGINTASAYDEILSLGGANVDRVCAIMQNNGAVTLGVYSYHSSFEAIYASATGMPAIVGNNGTGIGVKGQTSSSGTAVYGSSTSGAGVKGYSASGYSMYSDGNMYVVQDCSAASFTDRTPAYDGDALAELRQVKSKGGEIDHDTLPAFTRRMTHRAVPVTDEKTGEVKKDKKGERMYEHVPVPGRDLGATVSMLVVALQQLADRLDQAEARIK